MLIKNLTYEYIRGLVEGEGTFTFSTTTYSYNKKRRVPAFAIKMHVRDRYLLGAICEKLDLKNRIYIYHYPGKDGSNRGEIATLIVREFGALKNIIIPVFYRQLRGNKGIQFENWLEKIGTDPLVPERFRLLYRLHKTGYFERELSPGGLFRKFLE